MKRKTFIKFLMGPYCMERNKANAMADAVRQRGESYVDGLRKYHKTVKEWAKTFDMPMSMLLTREKGANKAYRRHVKSQKRAAHVVIYTHQNKPAPGARVTLKVGRSEPEIGGNENA